MANQPRSRNDPPIEEEGKRHQLPRGVVERDKEYALRKRARYAPHGYGMVRALGVFKGSKRGERNLDDLLDGTWTHETRLREMTSAESWIWWLMSQGVLEMSR